MNKIYAGIGSRQTPDEILWFMEDLGRELGQRGWLLRSGAAAGADFAFESGCDKAGVPGGGAKEIMLPWPGLNNHSSHLWLPRSGTVYAEAIKIAKSIHPRWNYLGWPAKQMHARNVLQVLGYYLDKPADCIICWTKGGQPIGGTATAIRVAEASQIPVFNLGLPEPPLQALSELTGLDLTQLRGMLSISS